MLRSRPGNAVIQHVVRLGQTADRSNTQDQRWRKALGGLDGGLLVLIPLHFLDLLLGQSAGLSLFVDDTHTVLVVGSSESEFVGALDTSSDRTYHSDNTHVEQDIRSLVVGLGFDLVDLRFEVHYFCPFSAARRAARLALA